MIFDTGSSWVWVQSDDCKNCMKNDHKFVPDDSESYKQLSFSKSELNYGKGSVIGYDSKDMVCLMKDSELGDGCMKDYLFKTIVQQRDLKGLATAGIIGLSPSGQDSGAQLFIPSLYEQGAIKNNMFSIYIDNNKKSKIHMGGYDLARYATGPLNFHKLSSDQFWEMPLHRVRAGSLSFKPVVQRVMADSGTSLNLMPEHDYKKIFNHFFKDKFKCQRLKNTLTMCDCTEEQHQSIPDIHFTLDGTEYKINRDQWFERAPSHNKCVIKLMHGPHKPYWILGLNFFTNYYTVFDYKNKQIGFAESINMGKPMNKGFINWCLSSAGIYDEDYLAK